jgi:hypothetical protein
MIDIPSNVRTAVAMICHNALSITMDMQVFLVHVPRFGFCYLWFPGLGRWISRLSAMTFVFAIRCTIDFQSSRWPIPENMQHEMIFLEDTAFRRFSVLFMRLQDICPSNPHDKNPDFAGDCLASESVQGKENTII